MYGGEGCSLHGRQETTERMQPGTPNDIVPPSRPTLWLLPPLDSTTSWGWSLRELATQIHHPSFLASRFLRMYSVPHRTGMICEASRNWQVGFNIGLPHKRPCGFFVSLMGKATFWKHTSRSQRCPQDGEPGPPATHYI